MKFKSDSDRWVTAEQGGGLNGDPARGLVGPPPLVADRTDADLAAYGDGWQQFTVVDHDDGSFSLRCPNGMFVTAEYGGGGPVSTDRDVDGPWQRFSRVGDLVLCSDKVHYLKVRTDLARPVVDATGSLRGLRFHRPLVAGSGGGVPLVTRAPLGPFDQDSRDPQTGARLPVTTTLTQTPPPRGTLRWWRGNAWGVTLPDLPRVDGGAEGAAADRVLTWFLDRYGRDWEERIFRAHLERGYDRFVLSPQDSILGAGQSPADYVAMAQRVKAAGLFPCHMLFSKVYSGTNPDPALLDPLIDALLEADAIPLASVGWELNAFNSPAHLQRLIDHVADRLRPNAERLLYVHFLPHYAAWQPDRPGGSGADFWPLQVGKLTGLLYQCDPDWSAGMMQARLVDVLVRLKAGGLWGLSQDFDVVAWEVNAQRQFYGQDDEDRGDVLGYELLATPGPMPVMGFGNGARFPDGTPI